MKLEWIAAILFVGIAIYLNCDALRSRINLPNRTIATTHIPAIQMLHGWPTTMFVREGLFSSATGKSVYPPADYARLGGFEVYSRYPIGDSPIIYLSIRHVAVNVFLIVLATVGICGFTRLLRDRGYLPIQFRIRTALVVFLPISVLLAFRKYLPEPYELFHATILLSTNVFLAMGIAYVVIELIQRLSLIHI